MVYYVFCLNMLENGKLRMESHMMIDVYSKSKEL